MGLQRAQGGEAVLSLRPPLRVSLAVAAVLLMSVRPTSTGCQPSPYRVLKEAGADFLGPGREEPDPEGLAAVRIGVIGPERRAEGLSLRNGVELALNEANARGGYRGIPFRVMFRADDGPWGMGAKQVAALAYEDSVWAVIGSLEGGDAHLAELVAAKLWVPVLTPFASDHTIDYANVPWVFRAAPSDVGQADLLAAYAAGLGRRLLAYVEDEREGRTGLARLEAAVAETGLLSVTVRTFRAHVPRLAVDAGDWTRHDAALIWARPEATLVMVEVLRETGYRGPVLLPSCGLSSQVLKQADKVGTLVVAAPFDLAAADSAMTGFQARYRASYGTDPDPIAALAYDTGRLAVAAVREAGLNRARIRDALARSEHDGLTGRQSFDALGGSRLRPVLLERRPGVWRRASVH